MEKYIIKKLELTESSASLGNSFENGVKVYLLDTDIYCAACDLEGMPTPEKITLFNGKKTVVVSNKLINQSAINIKEYLINEFKRI